MESLESCVQKLDMRSMPQFLDQVSDERENEASRHFAISLYAELARVHKQAVIPFIPRMMASIVRSLPFSADSQQLHEACAKVITSVARYTIDPTRPYDSNQQILCNLCSPLVPVLSSKLESSAAGAAICLQALVESEKWKFASTDLQDLLCTKATAALVEQGTHAVTFLHLVKSLAKFCMDASKKHVAEWLRVALLALQADTGLWQKRLAAAQLITIILKTADMDNLGIDLPLTMKILEAGLWDKVTVVQTAVAEAFETAKVVAPEKRLLCSGNHQNFTPGKTGSVDLSCESRRRFSDTEELGMQDLFDSVSPRSGASSHEAIPSMASSTVKFGTEPKRSKQRVRNVSYLSHLNGSLSRTSLRKENTPATIPRRVLSELSASGKGLVNSDFLPNSWEGKSLRRSSMDLGSKAASYSIQNQASLSSKKYAQHVHAPLYDGARKTASLAKKHVDGCQSTIDTDVPLKSISDTISKEDAKINEGLNGRTKESDKNSSEGSSHKKGCLQADVITSESDGDVGCANGGFSSKDCSMEARSKDSSSSGKESHLKVANSHDPSQEFAFRAPGSLLHSLQEKGSRQSCKESSKCENRAPSEECRTTSDSFTSGDSEDDQINSVNYSSRNASTVTSCCRSGSSDTCAYEKYKLSSCTNRHSLQNTSESASRLSSVLPNDFEMSASGQDWPSSRDSSDREVNRNAKLKHRHGDINLHKCSKESGSQRHCSAHAEGRPELPAAKLRELQHAVRGSGVSTSKGQMFAGAALVLFCAFGVVFVALMVIQYVNWSYGVHVLVPT